LRARLSEPRDCQFRRSHQKFARVKTSRRIQVDEPIDGMASQRRLSEWFHLSELLPAASRIMVQPSERRPNVRLNVLEDERVHVAWAQATQQIEDRETRRVCQPGPPD
jgi:hypothetical protein